MATDKALSALQLFTEFAEGKREGDEQRKRAALDALKERAVQADIEEAELRNRALRADVESSLRVLPIEEQARASNALNQFAESRAKADALRTVRKYEQDWLRHLENLPPGPERDARAELFGKLRTGEFAARQVRTQTELAEQQTREATRLNDIQEAIQPEVTARLKAEALEGKSVAEVKTKISEIVNGMIPGWWGKLDQASKDRFINNMIRGASGELGYQGEVIRQESERITQEGERIRQESNRMQNELMRRTMESTVELTNALNAVKAEQARKDKVILGLFSDDQIRQSFGDLERNDPELFKAVKDGYMNKLLGLTEMADSKLKFHAGVQALLYGDAGMAFTGKTGRTARAASPRTLKVPPGSRTDIQAVFRGYASSAPDQSILGSNRRIHTTTNFFNQVPDATQTALALADAQDEWEKAGQVPVGTAYRMRQQIEAELTQAIAQTSVYDQESNSVIPMRQQGADGDSVLIPASIASSLDPSGKLAPPSEGDLDVMDEAGKTVTISGYVRVPTADFKNLLLAGASLQNEAETKIYDAYAPSAVVGEEPKREAFVYSLGVMESLAKDPIFNRLYPELGGVIARVREAEQKRAAGEGRGQVAATPPVVPTVPRTPAEQAAQRAEDESEREQRELGAEHADAVRRMTEIDAAGEDVGKQFWVSDDKAYATVLGKVGGMWRLRRSNGVELLLPDAQVQGHLTIPAASLLSMGLAGIGSALGLASRADSEWVSADLDRRASWGLFALKNKIRDAEKSAATPEEARAQVESWVASQGPESRLNLLLGVNPEQKNDAYLWELWKRSGGKRPFKEWLEKLYLSGWIGKGITERNRAMAEVLEAVGISPKTPSGEVRDFGEIRQPGIYKSAQDMNRMRSFLNIPGLFAPGTKEYERLRNRLSTPPAKEREKAEVRKQTSQATETIPLGPDAEGGEGAFIRTRFGNILRQDRPFQDRTESLLVAYGLPEGESRTARQSARNAVYKVSLAVPGDTAANALLRATSTLGVDPLLAIALMESESSFDPLAVSETGASGLFQFVTRTWNSYAPGWETTPTSRRKARADNYRDPRFDPVLNAETGVRYLADLLRRNGGNVRAAIRGYKGSSADISRTMGLYERYKKNPELAETVLEKLSEMTGRGELRT